MKNKKGNKGYVVIKIDLEKASDKVKWEFVANVFEEIGLLDTVKGVMMQCISTSFMNIS